MGTQHRVANPLTHALGTAVAASGVISVIGGAAAWLSARAQLAGEHITIPDQAKVLPGRPVKGPVTAFAEAAAIKQTALALTHGKTYGELEEGDPSASTARDASLLRASLFTTVMAFAMAAAHVANGGTLIIVGTALRRLSSGSSLCHSAETAQASGK